MSLPQTEWLQGLKAEGRAVYAVFGAGGHGKVVADAIEQQHPGCQVVVFDDADDASSAWPLMGGEQQLLACRSHLDGVVVAIGSNPVRLAMQRRLQQAAVAMLTVVHPRACVSQYARLGAGTVVLAHAVINADARVGDAVIVNSAAVVEHDCRVADAVHLSPGAVMSGGSQVGQCSWLGAQSCLRQLITVADGVTVGAGAVVVADVAANDCVVGVPAKPLKSE
ncbi:acetyltransferase [Ferrimonas sp. SCSIO 43195]|uniref:acetyltransferase n=1 Tax=Ferrimonas sp. SCSIO 43195 TaxID=2822844 RepID=UPI0020766150|nr:acetyltransferase [Ferrimonas sp. SCSIO 43195]USD37745.1 acetyltransferase [Ferrimonas sp. SCSIO 43195]